MSDDEFASNAPRVGSVANALAILELLADSPTPIGVTAIAKSLGLSPSSCFNILKTLVAERYVSFDNKRKLYTLGYAPIRLARRSLDPTSAFPLMQPLLERLANEFGVTTALWRVGQDDRFLLLGYCEHAGSTRINMSVGQRMPVYMGTLGRCVAFNRRLSREAMLENFQKLRWHHPPTFDDYVLSIQEAGRRHWAIDVDQTFRGVTNIGATMLDAQDQTSFGITATMFSGQATPDVIERLGAEMVKAASTGAQLIGLR